MLNQRKIALNALIAVGKNEGYSNIVLKKVFDDNNVTAAEKPFITALFYGTLDRIITLDFVISKFVKRPISKIPPLTLFSLRMAIFQILYMDKVPDSAAVNEAVRLVKNSKEKYNAGFVNAVLRNLLRQGADIPSDNSPKSLKIRFSCPEWIINGLIADYGIENIVCFLEHSLLPPEITVRINNTLISDSEFLKTMLDFSVQTELINGVPHAAIIKSGVDVKSLDGFKNGLFHVQDLPSQIAVKKLGVKAGDRVLDMCASPGGKSFTASEICGGECDITCFDIHEKRVELINAGAKRLKLGKIKAAVWDSRIFNKDLGFFDTVICDVPCSGLGVIRRKPEIKYKTDIDLSELRKTQTEIIENGIGYLKKNGRLLYSTCTLRRAENEEIVRACLDKHPDFELEYEHTFLSAVDNTDGFYFAVIKSR